MSWTCVQSIQFRSTMLLMAVLAEWERDQISTRTKAALQAAKARGVRLGNPNLKADNKARSKAAKVRAQSLKVTLQAFKAQGLHAASDG